MSVTKKIPGYLMFRKKRTWLKTKSLSFCCSRHPQSNFSLFFFRSSEKYFPSEKSMTISTLHFDAHTVIRLAATPDQILFPALHAVHAGKGWSGTFTTLTNWSRALKVGNTRDIKCLSRRSCMHAVCDVTRSRYYGQCCNSSRLKKILFHERIH